MYRAQAYKHAGAVLKRLANSLPDSMRSDNRIMSIGLYEFKATGKPITREKLVASLTSQG